MRVPSSIRLLGWLAVDRARRRILPLVAALLRAASSVVWRLDRRRGLGMLLKAERFRSVPGGGRRVRSRLAADGDLVRTLTPDDGSLDHAVSRSVVLEAPRMADGRVVPGVLLIKFTDTLRFYVHHVDLTRLQDYFRMIVEPSWAGYAVPDILSLSQAPDAILIEAADASDRAFIGELDSSLVPIAIGSGDWVDHRVFRPLDLPRDYDAAYVANYSPGKRIHVFLRAVRDANRRRPFRTALICSRWGPGRAVVQEMIRWYGVGEHVDLYESLSQEELNEVLNRARCNVLMSLKEGSNRSLFESMFSGLPALLLEENVGVNRQHFGPETGIVVAEASVADAMIRLSDEFDSFSPREWAMANISPEATTRKVSEELRALFPEDGPDAHSTLLVKTNSPEARYFDHAMRGREAEISRAALSLFLKDAPELLPTQVVARIQAAFEGR